MKRYFMYVGIGIIIATIMAIILAGVMYVVSLLLTKPLLGLIILIIVVGFVFGSIAYTTSE